MGLSIAVAGGIICVTVLAIFSIVFSLSGQVYEINSSRTKDASQDSAYLQTNFVIQYLNGDSGNDLVGLTLNNTGNEKLWEYEKFTVIVTYNATIFGSPVETTENLEYNSAEAFKEVGEAQFLRPDSDISIENWDDPNGNDNNLMWDDIDEATRDDTDYVTSGNINNGEPSEALQVGLTDATDPQSSTDHLVKYAYRGIGPGSVNLTVQLMQGALEIASWTHLAIGTTFTQANQTLSTAEADSITDYNDLRFIFTGNHAGGGSANVEISWAEMEILECSAVAISAGQWTIDRISGNLHDPQIINTKEGGNICIKLSNNIHAGSNLISTVSTDVGKTATNTTAAN